MPVTILVGNESFQYPSGGQSPNWSEEATATIQKIAEVLNSLFGPDDIENTNATIANTQASPTNVNGLVFNTSTVRAATINYTIYRVTGSNEVAESGEIYIVYKNNANSWELNREFAGDAGVVFTITSGGQLQYTSNTLSGTGYSGTMRFSASTVAQ